MSKSRNERWAMDTSDLIDECEELETTNERLKAVVVEREQERDEARSVARRLMAAGAFPVGLLKEIRLTNDWFTVRDWLKEPR